MRVFIVTLLAGMALLSQRVDAYDFNNTFVHYMITSSQNLGLELQRTAERVESIRDDHPNVFVFRFDFPVPKDDDDLAFLMGMLGARSQLLGQDDGFHFYAYGGLTFFSINRKTESNGETNMDSLATVFNILIGAQGGYREWIEAKASVSFNVMQMAEDVSFRGGEAGETIFDFDAGSFALWSPFIGSDLQLRYDFSGGQVRDAEAGYTFDLEEWKIGKLRLAYSGRFDYNLTGILVRNDIDPPGRRTMAGDHGGTLNWENLTPLGHLFEFGNKIVFGGGVALSSVDGVLRYGYGSLGVKATEKVLIFVRGGTAWSRIDEKRFVGVGGGADYIINEYFYLRLMLGYRDFDTIDRIGDTGGFVIGFSAAGTI